MAITNGTSPTAGNIGISTSPNQAATYNGQNIIIPNEAAGIGDIVFKIVQNNVTTIKVMAGTTYDANLLGGISALNTTTNVYSSGPMSGYTLMGVIYGWEGGCAMICAKDGPGKMWASGCLDSSNKVVSTDIGTIPGYPDYTSTAGKPRNCFQSGSGNQTYLAMDIAKIKSYSDNAALTSTLLHPTHVIHPDWASWAGVATAQMSISNFNNGTGGAKAMYKTYEAYLAQCKPMGRGGGGVFSQKYHRGREYTEILYNATKTVKKSGNTTTDSYDHVPFPAAQYCWNYGAGGGTYWLPDMVELLQMMRDETKAIVNKALTKLGGTALGSDAWSSVRYSSACAWNFSSYGFSYANYFGLSYSARPVTLLKL